MLIPAIPSREFLGLRMCPGGKPSERLGWSGGLVLFMMGADRVDLGSVPLTSASWVCHNERFGGGEMTGSNVPQGRDLVPSCKPIARGSVDVVDRACRDAGAMTMRTAN